ncbi:unnamed protein product [Rotaria socialis]|uniref:Uncharacterized protein n=2 Tax=Rotaria socialis TaxID=392032 RepID=A0A821TXF5_9BILA|nr:unnamed protein product [Rotaria socialis]
MTDDDMSSLRIAKELRKVVSERTVRRWQHLYRSVGTIDLKIPPGTIGGIIHDDLHLHVYHVTIQSNLKDEHKQGRVSFAYWVRKSLRKQDQEKILFFDEKYFELDGICNHQNGRVYAAYRQDANEHKKIRLKAKFPKRIMIWFAISKNGCSIPIIFQPGETLTHKNYIEIVVPHAVSEEQSSYSAMLNISEPVPPPELARPSLELVRPSPEIARPILELARPILELARPIQELVGPSPELVRPIPGIPRNPDQFRN